MQQDQVLSVKSYCKPCTSIKPVPISETLYTRTQVKQKIESILHFLYVWGGIQGGLDLSHPLTEKTSK